jgi:F0F1-type ATP synthase membrane subunit c/vacuolar-type H+-ATPase subunit K
MGHRVNVVKASALAGAALGAGVAIGSGLRLVFLGAAFGVGVGLALGVTAAARRPDELEPSARPFELAEEV